MHFSAGYLGGGRVELYVKTPIEKWEKSQEVDTESVYFLGSGKIKNARKNYLTDRRVGQRR
jgi:hypothetical protein